MKTPGTLVAKKVPGVASRAIQAARYTIAGIVPSTWMSPLQPLPPVDPITGGRQYDYEVGRNLFYRPRSSERYSFEQLAALARNSELLRLAIETRKDQMDAMGWKIVPKNNSSKDENDPVILEISRFFEKPDKIHDWAAWIRVILESFYVNDATTIMPRMTRGGIPYSFDLMDGATIFPLIDAQGRRPLPPSPAFQQILKGMPKVDYTSDELIQAVRNVQVNTPYGFSPTEQVAMSAKTDIERTQYQLSYFTEGSAPDTVITMPDGMTPDKIEAYERHFNNILSGNYAERRKVPFLIFGAKIEPLKPPPLKDDFDEWIWRKIALAVKMSPTALVKQMNRSSSESDKERGEEEGLSPIMVWIKRLIDSLIYQYFGIDDVEFVWQDDKEQDPKQAADIDVELAKAGILTINEIRAARGLPDVEGGDIAMLATATGYVPIDGSKPINAPETDPESQNSDGSPKSTDNPDMSLGHNDSKTDAKKFIKKKSLYGSQYR